MSHFWFRLARSRFAGWWVGVMFMMFAPLLPLRQLAVSRKSILFAHPVPYWSIHWLAIPRRPIASFSQLDFQDEDQRDILLDTLFSAVRYARTHALPVWTLIVNGGERQDVGQMHWHMTTGERPGAVDWNSADWHIEPSRSADVLVRPHPNPQQPTHLIVESPDCPPLSQINFDDELQSAALLDALTLAQKAVEKESMDGWSLMVHSAPPGTAEYLMLHVVGQ